MESIRLVYLCIFFTMGVCTPSAHWHHTKGGAYGSSGSFSQSSASSFSQSSASSNSGSYSFSGSGASLLPAGISVIPNMAASFAGASSNLGASSSSLSGASSGITMGSAGHGGSASFSFGLGSSGLIGSGTQNKVSPTAPQSYIISGTVDKSSQADNKKTDSEYGVNIGSYSNEASYLNKNQNAGSNVQSHSVNVETTHSDKLSSNTLRPLIPAYDSSGNHGSLNFKVDSYGNPITTTKYDLYPASDNEYSVQKETVNTKVAENNNKVATNNNVGAAFSFGSVSNVPSHSASSFSYQQDANKHINNQQNIQSNFQKNTASSVNVASSANNQNAYQDTHVIGFSLPKLEITVPFKPSSDVALKESTLQTNINQNAHKQSDDAYSKTQITKTSQVHHAGVVSGTSAVSNNQGGIKYNFGGAPGIISATGPATNYPSNVKVMKINIGIKPITEHHEHSNTANYGGSYGSASGFSSVSSANTNQGSSYSGIHSSTHSISKPVIGMHVTHGQTVQQAGYQGSFGGAPGVLIATGPASNYPSGHTGTIIVSDNKLKPVNTGKIETQSVNKQTEHKISFGGAPGIISATGPASNYPSGHVGKITVTNTNSKPVNTGKIEINTVNKQIEQKVSYGGSFGGSFGGAGAIIPVTNPASYYPSGHIEKITVTNLKPADTGKVEINTVNKQTGHNVAYGGSFGGSYGGVGANVPVSNPASYYPSGNVEKITVTNVKPADTGKIEINTVNKQTEHNVAYGGSFGGSFGGTGGVIPVTNPNKYGGVALTSDTKLKPEKMENKDHKISFTGSFGGAPGIISATGPALNYPSKYSGTIQTSDSISNQHSATKTASQTNQGHGISFASGSNLSLIGQTNKPVGTLSSEAALKYADTGKVETQTSYHQIPGTAPTMGIEYSQKPVGVQIGFTNGNQAVNDYKKVDYNQESVSAGNVGSHASSGAGSYAGSLNFGGSAPLNNYNNQRLSNNAYGANESKGQGLSGAGSFSNSGSFSSSSSHSSSSSGSYSSSGSQTIVSNQGNGAGQFINGGIGASGVKGSYAGTYGHGAHGMGILERKGRLIGGLINGMAGALSGGVTHSGSFSTSLGGTSGGLIQKRIEIGVH